MGVKLCERGPAGFIVTDEGQRVLEATNRLIAWRVNPVGDELYLTGYVGGANIYEFDGENWVEVAVLTAELEGFPQFGENVALLTAQVERELQQLVSAVDVRSAHNFCDPQVNGIERVDVNLIRKVQGACGRCRLQ